MGVVSGGGTTGGVLTVEYVTYVFGGGVVTVYVYVL